MCAPYGIAHVEWQRNGSIPHVFQAELAHPTRDPLGRLAVARRRGATLDRAERPDVCLYRFQSTGPASSTWLPSFRPRTLWAAWAASTSASRSMPVS